MTEQEYAGVRAVRSGHVKEVARSPLHYVHAVHEEMARAKDGDLEPTEAKKIGTATHCLCLEDAEFDARYIVYDVDKRPSPSQTFALALNKQWRERQELAAKESNRELITLGMYEKSVAMKGAIKANFLANEVLNSVGIHEELHTWIDKYTGIQCKCRLDKRRKGTRGVDLKTTRDARPSHFIRDVFNLGYHIQGAFYMMGANLTEFQFVAIENTAPHGVLCFPLSQDAIDTANYEIKIALKTIKQCRDLYGSEYEADAIHKWPSYHFEHVDGFTINVPTWYKNQVGLNMEYQP